MDSQTVLAILVGVALACFSLVMVGYSFFRNRSPRQEAAATIPGQPDDGVGLDSLLDSLDTLELEHQLGNIPEEQYTEQLNSYRHQIALLIKSQLESEDPPPELLLEQEVLRARADGVAVWQSCPQCDAPLPVLTVDGSDAFTCPHCDASLLESAPGESDPEALPATSERPTEQ